MSYYINYYIHENNKKQSFSCNLLSFIPEEHTLKVNQIITHNKKENIFNEYANLYKFTNLKIIEISNKTKIDYDLIPDSLAQLQKLYLIKFWKSNRERKIILITSNYYREKTNCEIIHFDIMRIGYKIFKDQMIIFDINSVKAIPENIKKINIVNLIFDKGNLNISNLKLLFNNLPIDLERLQIHTDYLNCYNFISLTFNIFENLPPLLKKIIFLSPNIENKTRETIFEKIKIPFDCKVKVKIINPWIVYKKPT